MKIKNKNFKILLFLFLIDIFTLFFNFILTYGFNHILNNDFIFYTKIIRIILISLINLFLCIKFIFKKNIDIRKITIFLNLFLITLFTRKFLLYFFSKHYIFLSNNMLRIVVDGLFISFDIFLKLKLFNFENVIDYTLNIIKKIYFKINNGWIKLCNKLKIIGLLLPKNIFLFTVFIIMIITSVGFYNKNNDIVLYEQSNVDSNVGPLISGEKYISFKNVKAFDNVDIICLKFATYNRVNDSILSIKLYNERQKKVFSSKINTKSIADGINYCFDVPKIQKKRLSLYKLKISPLKSDENNFVTLYKDKKTNDIAMSLMKKNDNSVKKIALFAIIGLYFLLNILLNIFWKKIPEHKFLLMMLIYIIPLIFVYPPFSTPDENLHFYQSFSASQTVEINELKKIELPKNIDCLNYTGINFRVDNYKKVSKCGISSENKKYDIDKSPGMERNITPSSVSIGYLFQSLSIKVVDFFTNSPLFIYYISKFLASLASFILIYFSLIKIKKYKRVLLFLVTMPMFIQQMCSFSYDSLLNSMIIIFFTWYINTLLNKNEISLKNFIPFIIVLVYLIILKIVYLPFALLIAFIPLNKFKSKKNKWVNISISLIISFLIAFMIKKVFVTNSIVSSTGMKQISFIINNPFYMITVLKNTLIQKLRM